MGTDEEFAEVVKQANSVADVLRLVRRARVGTNYAVVRERISSLGLSTNHWKRTGSATRLSLNECLRENSTYSRVKLKQRLITAGLLKNVCALCGCDPVWMGKPLVLRLDHENGVNDDGRLENLRLLCPNCDSQSSTYCGRNKKSPDRSDKRKCSCGTPISARASRCKPCQLEFLIKISRNQKTKINWPRIGELEAMLKTHNFSECGRLLGVSDNAVRKRLLNHGGDGGI